MEATARPEVIPVSHNPRLKMLSIKEVIAHTGFSKAFIYSEIAKGNFPRPMQQGGRSVWRQTTLEAHFDKLERKVR